MLVPNERFVTVSKETGVSPQEGEQMLKDNTAGIFSVEVSRHFCSYRCYWGYRAGA